MKTTCQAPDRFLGIDPAAFAGDMQEQQQEEDGRQPVQGLQPSGAMGKERIHPIASSS
ncbi:MAG: hypothetical protein AAGA21_24490 [Pseudomonadota bacterium]